MQAPEAKKVSEPKIFQMKVELKLVYLSEKESCGSLKANAKANI